MVNWDKLLPIIIPTAAAAVTGGLAYKAAKGASKSQQESVDSSNLLLKNIYDQNRADLAPQREAGYISLDAIMNGLGMPTTSSRSAVPGAGGTGAPGGSPFVSTLDFRGANVKGPSTAGGAIRGAMTGAAAGSFVPGVGTLVGAGAGALIGGIKNQFHKGSREANQISPNQNQLTTELDRIIAEVNARAANGTLTQNDMATAKSTVDRLINDFGTYTDQFTRAGGGADKSIADTYGNITKDWGNWQGSLPTDNGAGGVGINNITNANPNSPVGPGDQGYFSKTFTPNDLYIDPSYQFILSEGQKALENTAAARGMALSGSAMKAMARYTKNVASTEYQNAHDRFTSDQDRLFNKYATVSGIGQVATNQGVNLAQNYGNSVSDNLQAAGNAKAAGIVGSTNAINNAITGGANTIGEAMLLRDIFGKQAA